MTSQYFNSSEIHLNFGQDDGLNSQAPKQLGLSPKKRSTIYYEDLSDPLFSSLVTGGVEYPSTLFNMGANMAGNNLLQDLKWENQFQIPSLSRGPSNNQFEIPAPASKKIKTDSKFGLDSSHLNLLTASLGPQAAYTNASSKGQAQLYFNNNPVMSTNQSETSQIMSGGNASFQVSGSSISFASHSRSDESSSLLHATSQFEHSASLEHDARDESYLAGSSGKKNRRGAKEEQKAIKNKKNSLVDQSFDKKPEVKKNSSSGSKVSFKNDESQSVRQRNGSHNDTTYDEFQRLTNKKREYLEEVIVDKNGEYLYDEDPQEYKKARKRMQNRESAVRSRMRKKYHQDILEVKIQELEKVQKEISEQNAGLSAQNALLKKQLAYFEDIFAKSSLLGFDPMNQGNISRGELEKFQRNLLRKINRTLTTSSDRENLDIGMPDSSIEQFQPHSPLNLLDDVDQISTNSLSGCNQRSDFQIMGDYNSSEHVDSLRLVRSRSNSSSFSNTGYLFLAIVFCMMCCSSLLVSPDSVLQLTAQTQSFASIISQPATSFYAGQRKLMSANEAATSPKQQNLASPLNEDSEMTEETTVSHKNVKLAEEEQQIGAVKLVKLLLTGQYTYLTYMLLSTTCFFFWLMPNFHKVRSLFSFFGQSSSSAIKKSSRRSNASRQTKSKQAPVTTRSQSLRQRQ